MEQMQDLFIRVLNMSITASYVVLFVCIIRILLKKVPKVFSYSLWSVVLFRLICPISFSSFFSLFGRLGRINVQHSSLGALEYIPSNIGMMKQPQVELGVNSVNKVVNNLLPPAVNYASINPMQVYILLITIIWIAGICLLLTYWVISYLTFKHRLSTAMLLRDNIYESDQITSPFVLGFLKPRIYIPVGINKDSLPIILKHEQTHIARFDHVIKLIAFLVLTIHWFNPLIWCAFRLMTKDMEMSCDEKVIKELGKYIKVDYSNALLNFALKKQITSGSPLAFGESNTKERIKNVMNYNRPAFWFIIATIIVCLGVVIVSIANPLVEISNEPNQIRPLTKQLYENKTEYVGNNNEVSSLINLLPVPHATTYNSIELNTLEEPYGITIYYDMEYDLMIPDEYEFTYNSIYLLAIIDNVDKITHIGKWNNSLLSSESFHYDYTRADMEELLGKDLRVYSESEEALDTLMWDIGKVIKPFDANYTTNFTDVKNGHNIGLYMTQSNKVALELVSLLLSGNDSGTSYTYETPETNDYLKIELGDNKDKIYYIFEENNEYFVMKPKDYIRELPKESFDAIVGFLGKNDRNNSSVTTAEPVK